LSYASTRGVIYISTRQIARKKLTTFWWRHHKFAVITKAQACVKQQSSLFEEKSPERDIQPGSYNLTG